MEPRKAHTWLGRCKKILFPWDQSQLYLCWIVPRNEGRPVNFVTPKSPTRAYSETLHSLLFHELATFFRRKWVLGNTLLLSAKFLIIEFDSAYLAWHFTALRLSKRHFQGEKCSTSDFSSRWIVQLSWWHSRVVEHLFTSYTADLQADSRFHPSQESEIYCIWREDTVQVLSVY